MFYLRDYSALRSLETRTGRKEEEAGREGRERKALEMVGRNERVGVWVCLQICGLCSAADL